MISDTTASTVSDFAAELRALRLDAESPTLVHLQFSTGISRTVLSSSFGGKQLPSARTVDRLTRALGGDPAEWVRRRDAIANQLGSADRPLSQVGLSRRTASLLMAGTFVLGVVLSGGVSWAVSTTVVAQAKADGAEAARRELTSSPVNPRAQINVLNGVDPAMTPCVNDAKVATSATRTNDTLIEIIWSNKCYAGWARITRYDEKFSGNSMTVAIYPETAAQGPDRQAATEPNVQSAYTTLVVRPTPQTRLCAVGAVTIAGESIDLGEPLCS